MSAGVKLVFEIYRECNDLAVGDGKNEQRVLRRANGSYRKLLKQSMDSERLRLLWCSLSSGQNSNH